MPQSLMNRKHLNSVARNGRPSVTDVELPASPPAPAIPWPPQSTAAAFSSSGGVESRHAPVQKDRTRVGKALPVTAAAQSTTGQPCAHRAGIASGPLTLDHGDASMQMLVYALGLAVAVVLLACYFAFGGK